MYEVRFYQGDYKDRQRDANQDGCVAYVEQHFNSSDSATAGYAEAIVTKEASQLSREWGRFYAKEVAREFGVPLGGDDGIVAVDSDGRGYGNLSSAAMPAILVEPLFTTNPEHKEWIVSEEGQERLAQALVASIRRFFPGGGRIGFSVGHKYKRSRPDDRGAELVGGGWEGDYAEKVLLKAQALLSGASPG